MSKEEQLKWYQAMGIDDIGSEKTTNQLKTPTPEATATPVTANENKNTTAMSSPHQLMQLSKSLADQANSLSELEDAVRDFTHLSICKTATNTVFCDGQANSDIMMIGEAPGAEEDKQGIPFCGASGKLLDQMLECIGLSRQKNFYITNTLFWRPPGNRRPTPEEINICKPFVEKHIALFKPKLIILIGGTAITSVLASKQGITKMRGKFFDYSNGYTEETTKLTALFHPSYLLRSPGQKRLAWQDLLMIDEHLNGK